MSLLMKIMYIAQRSRPDVLFQCTYLSTFSKAPTVNNRASLMQILMYLHGTKDQCVTFTDSAANQGHLEVYVDASYDAHVDHRSHTGMVIKWHGNTIHAGSSKQKQLALSSTHAEVIGVNQTIQKAQRALHVCRFICPREQLSMKLFQDNTASVKLLLKDHDSYSRNINIKLTYMHELVKSKILQVVHQGTKAMIADVLTKALYGDVFHTMVSSLMH